MMIVISICLSALVMLGGMYLLAKSKAEMLGRFFSFVSYFLITTGFLCLAFSVCLALYRCCYFQDDCSESDECCNSSYSSPGCGHGSGYKHTGKKEGCFYFDEEDDDVNVTRHDTTWIDSEGRKRVEKKIEIRKEK